MSMLPLRCLLLCCLFLMLPLTTREPRIKARANNENFLKGMSWVYPLGTSLFISIRHTDNKGFLALLLGFSVCYLLLCYKYHVAYYKVVIINAKCRESINHKYWWQTDKWVFICSSTEFKSSIWERSDSPNHPKNSLNPIALALTTFKKEKKVPRYWDPTIWQQKNCPSYVSVPLPARPSFPPSMTLR